MDLMTQTGKNSRTINYKGLVDILNSQEDVITFDDHKSALLIAGFIYNIFFRDLTFDLFEKNAFSMQANKKQRPELNLYINNIGNIRYKKDSAFNLIPNIHMYSTNDFVKKYFLNKKHKHTPFKEKKEKAINDIINSIFNNLIINKTIYTKDIVTKLNLCMKNNNKKYLKNLNNKIPNNVPYEKKAPIGQLKSTYNTVSFIYFLSKKIKR